MNTLTQFLIDGPYAYCQPFKDFKDYVKLAEAIYENPRWNPIRQLAFVLAYLHSLIATNPELFEQLSKELEERYS